MSVKKTVESTAKRLAKIGEHKDGELHHIEVHPAENGFTVHHHAHKGPSKKNDRFDYLEGPHHVEKTVHESAKSAHKHVKGILEEHEGGMKALDKNQSGKPVDNEKDDMEED